MITQPSIIPAQKLWRIKFGYRYKGLKEVPSNDVKECLDTCKNSDKCFASTWTNDLKCHVQDDGDANLKPDNLENAEDAITFLGKTIKLRRFRKFGKQLDYGINLDDILFTILLNLKLMLTYSVIVGLIAIH